MTFRILTYARNTRVPMAYYTPTGGGTVWVTRDYYPRLHPNVHVGIDEDTGELVSYRRWYASTGS